MFKIFIALASFQVLNSIHGFCMVCASIGHGITAKSFSDSVMNPKRPRHQMQTVDPQLLQNIPLWGLWVGIPAALGYKGSMGLGGASLTQQGTLGLHCVDFSLQGHPRQGQVPVIQAINN